MTDAPTREQVAQAIHDALRSKIRREPNPGMVEHLTDAVMPPVEALETERDGLLALVQEAIQAHRDLHRIYGDTAVCGGGIGGQAVTQHCGVTCGYFECHEAENDRWYRVESAYFKHQEGNPNWRDALEPQEDK